jgi:hypothetical protein
LLTIGPGCSDEGRAVLGDEGFNVVSMLPAMSCDDALDEVDVDTLGARGRWSWGRGRWSWGRSLPQACDERACRSRGPSDRA